MSEPDIPELSNDGIVLPTPLGEKLDNQGAVEPRGIDQLFLDYYGLNEQPFGVTPDLRFLYLGAKHREALDTLNYATELNRGFMTLIAKPGMGKTSLLFQYLEGLRDKARTVFLFQTDCDSTELMRYLLVELGLDGKGMDLPEMRAVLSQVLMGEMQAGRRFILVIDEAQNLSPKVLESIRLLSNFETPWMKLMHIVLAGQPELAERLARPSMSQLRQRVSFAIRLEPFTREEVDLYVSHRLWVAGCKTLPLFSIGARTMLAERSEGIPRNINNICFRAMSLAWAMKRKTIDRDTMSEALAELDTESPVVKGAIAPKLPDEPKPGVSEAIYPIGLTPKPSSTRGSFSQVVILSMVFFGLCVLGFQPNVERWVESSYDDISTALKDFFVPSASHEPLDPVSVVGPDNSSMSPKPAEVPGARDFKLPQPDGIGSFSTDGRHD